MKVGDLAQRQKKPRAKQTQTAAGKQPSQKLVDLLVANWKLLSAAFAVLAALVSTLGHLVHGSRTALLGLDQPIRYSKTDSLLTSLDVMLSWLRHGLAALFAGHGVLLVAAWVPLLLLGALFWTERLPTGWRKRATIGVVIIWVGALMVAWVFYSSALFPPRTPLAKGPDFEPMLVRSWQGQATFEVVNWLTNDSPRNAGRRTALSGLVGLFLLASGLGGYRIWRRADLKLWLRRGGAIAGCALTLAFAVLVPRAYVVGSWGLRYPAVRIKVGENCDKELAAALATGHCCAFDIAEGGEPRYLLLRGSGCPGGRGTFVTVMSEHTDCIELDSRRGIFHGCG